MNVSSISVLLATGGTAGHVFPALAIAEELESQGISFHFTTSKTGIVNEWIEAKGFPVTSLKVRGFEISKNPFSKIGRNLKALRELFTAKKEMKKLLAELKPNVILATGGYAALPVGLAAKSQKIPLVVLEPNAVLGKANKILSKRASTTIVGFEESKVSNSVHLGIPVRKSILKVNRSNQVKAKEQLGVKEMVVVIGGSLGSTNINKTLLASLEKLNRQRPMLSIYHIVGERDWEVISKETAAQTAKNYTALKFEDRMENLFEAADLFVSRAGANIIAELDVTGTPAILIPWAKAAGNHQVKNAQSYARQSQVKTEILSDQNLTPEILSESVLKFFSDTKTDSPKTSQNQQASKLIVDLLKQYCQ